MTNDTRYIVWNLRTGDARTLKTKPRKEKVKPEEVAFEAHLKPVSYEEEQEGENQDQEEDEQEVQEEDEEAEEETIFGEQEEEEEVEEE